MDVHYNVWQPYKSTRPNLIDTKTPFQVLIQRGAVFIIIVMLIYLIGSVSGFTKELLLTERTASRAPFIEPPSGLVILNPVKANAETFAFMDDAIPINSTANYGLEDILASQVMDDPTPSLQETSEYMMGRIAVYIIFVESSGEYDTNLYDWTKTDIERASNGIYYALNWWRDQYPFTYARPIFYVNRDPVIGYTKYEPIVRSKSVYNLDSRWDRSIVEQWANEWVPDVLSRLGCGSGSDHGTIARSCAHQIRQSWGTDWAFIIFVLNSGIGTPYWGNVFEGVVRAYAYRNGPYMVVPFGWFYHIMFEGTKGFASTVAHEIGHIFGATDEYNNKPERSGYLYEWDNDGSGCIMDSPNGWCISTGTRRQIGWVDDNYNGYPDILENRPSIILFSSPGPVIDAEEIVVEGAFRLEPYPCRREYPPCRSVTINRVIPLNATGILTALDGSFDTAYERFRLIYRPNKPGYHTILTSVMDAVVGKVESLSIRVLYTYVEVVEAMVDYVPRHPHGVMRVEVGSKIPLRYRLVFAHDKSPVQTGDVYIGQYKAVPRGNGFFEVVVTSNDVGRFVYTVTPVTEILGVQIRKAVMTAKPPEVIYDRVVVNLMSGKIRTDIGSAAPITYLAYYEYDKSQFVGEVIIQPELTQTKVGRYIYYVSSIIKDRQYGLSKFSGNTIEVIFDKVIVELSSTRRVDVGSVAPLSVLARYAYDSQPFDGEVKLSESLVKNVVGEFTYKVSELIDRKYGLKVFESNEVKIIFDKVKVVISGLPSRLQVGRQPTVFYNAFYEFDNRTFNGVVRFNLDNLPSNPGPYLIKVIEVQDNLYGLKTFETSENLIIFDKISASLTTDSLIPFMLKSKIKVWYAYDNAMVEDAVVALDGQLVKVDAVGTYVANRVQFLPVVTLSVSVSKEGFDDIYLSSTEIHIGNTLFYMTITTLLVLSLGFAKKKSKVRGINLGEVKTSRNSGTKAIKNAGAAGMYRVIIVRAGRSKRCLYCGKVSDINSSKCVYCGNNFFEKTDGLKCPICNGPLEYGFKLTPILIECCICSSYLRVEK